MKVVVRVKNKQQAKPKRSVVKRWIVIGGVLLVGLLAITLIIVLNPPEQVLLLSPTGADSPHDL